jgi:hypothetical protein
VEGQRSDAVKKPVFAIDVGGVLASKQHDGLPMEGCAEALHELSTLYDLWIVSQCGRNRALKTREWLDHWLLPIPATKQIYVPFSETKVEPLRKLDAVYFVDDRIKHVVPAINKVPSLRCVFHLVGEMKPEFQLQHPKYVWVPTWASLLTNLEQMEGDDGCAAG